MILGTRRRRGDPCESVVGCGAQHPTTDLFMGNSFVERLTLERLLDGLPMFGKMLVRISNDRGQKRRTLWIFWMSGL